MIDYQIAAMTAPRSPLEAAERQVLEAVWDESKRKRDRGRFAKKDVPGDAGKDLFGEPLKPERPALEPIVSLGGKQQNLFAKKGMPGQMSLFADAGVPDDMVATMLEKPVGIVKQDVGSTLPVEESPEFERKSLIDAVDNGKAIDTDMLSEYRDEIVEERPDLEGKIDRLLDEAENAPLLQDSTEPPNMEPHAITRTEVRMGKTAPSKSEYAGVGTSDVTMEPIYDEGRAKDPTAWKVRHTKTFQPVLYPQ